jgi:hypothetical protein
MKFFIRKRRERISEFIPSVAEVPVFVETVVLRFPVAVRFRAFSKKIARSHTDTLLAIMTFFEWHGFLLSDRFGQSIILAKSFSV